MEESRYISLSEAAAQFGLSRSQLRLLAQLGRLEAIKIGRNWVTTPEAVAAYLADPAARSKDPLKYKRR
ncbi:MAG: helix-turn-helix domain-containing protein [Chloroflexi bacterium]|nr:helix-turn-helix domain-containing protein [Chloroflexota bacterium]